MKFRVFWDVAPCRNVEVDRRFEWIAALMMEAVRTPETSDHFNVTTRRYIPVDSELHTRRRENLKSRKIYQVDEVKEETEKHIARITKLRKLS
jgi:hypothetical protein